MTRMRASIFSTMAAAGGPYSQGFRFRSIVRTPPRAGSLSPEFNPWRRLAIFTVSPMMVNDMACALPTSPTNDRT